MNTTLEHNNCRVLIANLSRSEATIGVDNPFSERRTFPFVDRKENSQFPRHSENETKGRKAVRNRYGEIRSGAEGQFGHSSLVVNNLCIFFSYVLRRK